MPFTKMFSEEQEMAIIARYKQGESTAKIALGYSCSARTIYQTLVRYAVPRRNGGPCEGDNPTPEEIEVATAKIRESWSEKERRYRAGLRRVPLPYTIPTEVETFVTASRDPDLHGILTGNDSWGLL